MFLTVTCKECNNTYRLSVDTPKDIQEKLCEHCGKKSLVREYKNLSVGNVMSSEMVGISQMMVNNGGK